jgi:hypothetical protein
VFFYGVAILVSGPFLMIIGVQQIEIYYALYFIEFLTAVELVSSFRRSLERNLRPVIITFLLGFIYVIVQRMLQILG